ncbi:hypothetical protein Tco_0709907 [Tanacetum coccineum]
MVDQWMSWTVVGVQLSGDTWQLLGDDDNFLCSMRTLLRPISWLGSHTKRVIAAMSSLWCRYCIHISEPHLRNLMILSAHPYFLRFFLKCQTTGELRSAHKRGTNERLEEAATGCCWNIG